VSCDSTRPDVDTMPNGTGSGKKGCGDARMIKWEYVIVALPQFQAPTQVPGGSAAVAALNREGEVGWEAVGMTALADGTVAVLLKRQREA
jgi:hypothetical protein